MKQLTKTLMLTVSFNKAELICVCEGELVLTVVLVVETLHV